MICRQIFHIYLSIGIGVIVFAFLVSSYKTHHDHFAYILVYLRHVVALLMLDFFDMWLCFDVGPFKTLQFEKVKLKNHFKIFWFVYIFQEISGLHTVFQICSVYSE